MFLYKPVCWTRVYSTLSAVTRSWRSVFAPALQPELWTEQVLRKFYSSLTPGGILVTHCSKGDVRRAMQAAGFLVEKIPGPPGRGKCREGRKSLVDSPKQLPRLTTIDSRLFYTPAHPPALLILQRYTQFGQFVPDLIGGREILFPPGFLADIDQQVHHAP